MRIVVSANPSADPSWFAWGLQSLQSILLGVSAALAYSYLQKKQFIDSSNNNNRNSNTALRLPCLTTATDAVFQAAKRAYAETPLWFWLGLSWTMNQGAGAGGTSTTATSTPWQRGTKAAPLWSLWAATAGGSLWYSYRCLQTSSNNNSSNNNNNSSNDDADDDSGNNNNNNGRTPYYSQWEPRDRPAHSKTIASPPRGTLNNNRISGNSTSNHSSSSNPMGDLDNNNNETTTQTTAHAPVGGKRYLELLVHNVSHSDLILSLDSSSAPDFDAPDEPSASQSADQTGSGNSNSNSSAADPYCFGRPRFSCFDLYTRRVLQALQPIDPAQYPTVDFPRYERSEASPRYSIKKTHTGSNPIPVGLVLPTASSSSDSTAATTATTTTTTTACVNVQELQELRVRGRDQTNLARRLYQESSPNATRQPQQEQEQNIAIRHVFFPLLASLLARWKQYIAEKEYTAASATQVKRVLILVTGVGTPRNWTHQVAGNSTEACADLMEYFLQRIDPDLTVVKIHSSTDYNIFRYDENLLFCERQLLPTINAYRDAHAHGWPYPDEQPLPITTNAAAAAAMKEAPFDLDWQKSLALTLSFADGSPARTYAIQASLRGYRPAYFHFWQLKTFWHESKIVDDDIEVLSFEEMETSPAVDASRCTDPMIQAVVQEMKAFRAEMVQTLQEDNDISKFWLRKTHKPVLAVLLVQSAGAKNPTLYRGTNMEVSMPTGSLCAERNVIGTALAANPSLKRQDLKLIAVLAVPPMEEQSSIKRTDSFISTSNESLSEHSSHKPSIGSEHEAEWEMPLPQTATDTSFTLVTNPLVDKQQCAECNQRSVAPTEQVVMSTPVRRIHLFSRSTHARKSKRTVVVQSTKDLNPLKPCGACNEWLKKIAEPNPYFRILTFTDANCNGIYISACQE